MTKQQLVELIATTIDEVGSLDNIGEYGYGGEVFDHYVLSNSEEIAYAIIDKMALNIIWTDK